MTRFQALSDLLTERYSCRAFQATPVPKTVTEDILRAAGRVPSWCNAQPWQVTITQPSATDAFRKALLHRVSCEAPSLDYGSPHGYSGAYAERRRPRGLQLYEAVGVQKSDRAGSGSQMLRNFELFDAPHVAIVSAPRELAAYGAIDCGGFITAFTLAARALGVDTTAQAAVASYPDFIRSHFDMSEDRAIVCAISFGYADESHPANSFRTARAPLADIVEWKE